MRHGHRVFVPFESSCFSFDSPFFRAAPQGATPMRRPLQFLEAVSKTVSKRCEHTKSTPRSRDAASVQDLFAIQQTRVPIFCRRSEAQEVSSKRISSCSASRRPGVGKLGLAFSYSPSLLFNCVSSRGDAARQASDNESAHRPVQEFFEECRFRWTAAWICLWSRDRRHL